MTRQVGVWAFVAAVAVAQASAPAQTTAPATSTRPIPALRAKMAQMQAAAKLSDEQSRKMEAVVAAAEKATRDLEVEFEPVKAEYDKARQAADPAAMGKVREKWAALWEKQKQLNAASDKELEGVLTSEQAAQWKESLTLGPVLARLRAAKLTDEQLAKIKEEFGKLSADTNAASRPDMIQGRLVQFIVAKVLTDEQKDDLVVEPILAAHKRANLTAEQVAKVRTECRRLRKEAAPGDPPYLLARQLWHFVSTSVLTDDQKQQMRPAVTTRPTTLPATGPATTPATAAATAPPPRSHN